MNWKKSTLCCISACVVTLHSLGCGFYPMGEQYRICFFSPFDKVFRAYQAQYFTSDLFNDSENLEGLEADRKRNCNEWSAMTGYSASPDDVYEVLYKYDITRFEAELADDRHYYVRNSFMRFLQRTQNLEWREYMLFAKRSEITSQLWSDPWLEDLEQDPLVASIRDVPGYYQFSRCKNAFLKKRYAFILTRMNEYGVLAEGVVDSAYNYINQHRNGSIVEYWADFYMASVAGIPDAGRNYGRAVLGSEEKLMPAVVRFHSQFLDTFLKSEPDRAVRSNLYALYALNHWQKMLPCMENCLRENPANDLLKIVLCREIQKCEDWLWTRPVTGFDPTVRNYYFPDSLAGFENYIRDTIELHDKQYALKLQSFIYKVLLKCPERDRSYYLLAAAHLATIRRSSAMARYYLNAYTARHDTCYALQFRVTQFLAETIDHRGLYPRDEKKCMETFALIRSSRSTEAQKLGDRLMQYVIMKEYEGGKTFKAALLNTHLNEAYLALEGNIESNYWVTYLATYGTPRDGDSLVKLLSMDSLTGFNRFVMDSLMTWKHGINSLREWTGSLFLREQMYAKAERVLRGINYDFWSDDFNNYGRVCSYNEDMMANTFHATHFNQHRINEYDTLLMNKYQVAVYGLKFTELARTSTGKTREVAELALAHAVFNMTVHGNSWVITCNRWSNWGGTWKKRGEEYYGCSKAYEAYRKLYRKARNKEVRAKCCLMMAVCKSFAAEFHEGKARTDYQLTHYWLNEFMAGYVNTETYEKALSACIGPAEFCHTYLRGECDN